MAAAASFSPSPSAAIVETGLSEIQGFGEFLEQQKNRTYPDPETDSTVTIVFTFVAAVAILALLWIVFVVWSLVAVIIVLRKKWFRNHFRYPIVNRRAFYYYAATIIVPLCCLILTGQEKAGYIWSGDITPQVADKPYRKGTAEAASAISALLISQGIIAALFFVHFAYMRRRLSPIPEATASLGVFGIALPVGYYAWKYSGSDSFGAGVCATYSLFALGIYMYILISPGEEELVAEEPYRIVCKASGNHIYANDREFGADYTVGTYIQDFDKHGSFIMHEQLDGSYTITVEATGNWLYSNCELDQLVYADEPSWADENGEIDPFGSFFFEQEPDGSYRIRVKSSGNYLHANDDTSWEDYPDQLLSTRYQLVDDYSRFVLKRIASEIEGGFWEGDPHFRVQYLYFAMFVTTFNLPVSLVFGCFWSGFREAMFGSDEFQGQQHVARAQGLLGAVAVAGAGILFEKYIIQRRLRGIVGTARNMWRRRISRFFFAGSALPASLATLSSTYISQATLVLSTVATFSILCSIVCVSWRKMREIVWAFLHEKAHGVDHPRVVVGIYILGAVGACFPVAIIFGCICSSLASVQGGFEEIPGLLDAQFGVPLGICLFFATWTSLTAAWAARVVPQLQLFSSLLCKVKKRKMQQESKDLL